MKNVIVIAALAVFFIVAISASTETKQQQVSGASTELPAGKYYYFSQEGRLQACALRTTYYALPACPNPDEVELFTSPEKGFFDRLRERQLITEEIIKGTR